MESLETAVASSRYGDTYKFENILKVQQFSVSYVFSRLHYPVICTFLYACVANPCISTQMCENS